MMPITTSSPRFLRRIASLSMLWVLPTPGAYPRNNLKIPRVFDAGETASSHSSGFFGKCSFSPGGFPCELQYNHVAPGCWARDRLCGRRASARLNLTRLQQAHPREPDDGCAFVSSGDSSSFGSLGHGGFRGHVGLCHAVIQLFVPPSDRHLHHRGSAELGGFVRVSVFLDRGQPAFRTHPAGGRRREQPPPRGRTPLRVQPETARRRERDSVDECDSQFPGGLLRSRLCGTLSAAKGQVLPLGVRGCSGRRGADEKRVPARRDRLR